MNSRRYGKEPWLEARWSGGKLKGSAAEKRQSVSRLIQIVRFDGTTKSSRSRQYTRLQSVTVKVPVHELSVPNLKRMVEKRLREDNFMESIVLTDAMGTLLAESATPDDLGAPNKK